MLKNNEATGSDKYEIDNIVKVFFDIFTNANQKLPNLAMLNTVCIPETIIIKKSGVEEEDIYTLENFIEPRKKILSDGTLTNFVEYETNEETQIIGNIAQRFSVYEKSGNLNGSFFKTSGNKLFQFIKTTAGWKINALIWEDH
jgi:hypothetical protein